ncbi:MAG: exonuclease SbcCD subunit D [Actinomycetota bacterium]|nr:exonuclease SbcCD subunit D [Actinomycetota bacterium]
MRLLHTSDWHLGRTFHREDLLSAQASFIDFLLDTVRAERIDAVVVAGDLYDRALPSVDAVAVCDDALRRLAAAAVPTVLISGNHDSARRLGFGADLIDAAGVHLRTDPRRCGEPVVVEDDHGPVAIYGIPYLEPDAARSVLDCQDRTHDAVLSAAMGRIRADLAHRRDSRSVVLAHAFVSGGSPSESERDISVGGALSVPAGVFAGVDYVALGHLHGAQRVAQSCHYSGSPLAYSFSEATHTKSVTVVDLEPGSGVRVERIPCPVPRRLARLRGRLEDLLGDATLESYEDHYLSVTLTDPARPQDPMQRLRRRFPHTLVLDLEPEGVQRDKRSYVERLRGLDDLAVATSFLADVRGRDAEASERALLTAALVAGARSEGDA